mmetsp:Transcript_15665/g.33837  ORF Transcript_15665/g.33837 Transcript_15665/m.33837 type:complete len:303 (-) Transcript_15665:845-1753(-)
MVSVASSDAASSACTDRSFSSSTYGSASVTTARGYFRQNASTSIICTADSARSMERRAVDSISIKSYTDCTLFLRAWQCFSSELPKCGTCSSGESFSPTAWHSICISFAQFTNALRIPHALAPYVLYAASFRGTAATESIIAVPSKSTFSNNNSSTGCSSRGSSSGTRFVYACRTRRPCDIQSSLGNKYRAFLISNTSARLSACATCSSAGMWSCLNELRNSNDAVYATTRFLTRHVLASVKMYMRYVAARTDDAILFFCDLHHIPTTAGNATPILAKYSNSSKREFARTSFGSAIPYCVPR